MRIDPPNGLTPQQPGQTPAGESANGADSRTAAGKAAKMASQQAVSMHRRYEAYVQAARDSDEVDTQAVADARQLLETGQLDTPDRARRAAEAMLRRGV
ncbi:MAG: hypothetical protein KGY99_05020 [Phycisphaerae bacterium]|nr:hypothetical protein [Phycisphaerae bacterium]